MYTRYTRPRSPGPRVPKPSVWPKQVTKLHEFAALFWPKPRQNSRNPESTSHPSGPQPSPEPLPPLPRPPLLVQRQRLQRQALQGFSLRGFPNCFRFAGVGPKVLWVSLQKPKNVGRFKSKVSFSYPIGQNVSLQKLQSLQLAWCPLKVSLPFLGGPFSAPLFRSKLNTCGLNSDSPNHADEKQLKTKGTGWPGTWQYRCCEDQISHRSKSPGMIRFPCYQQAMASHG